MLQALTNLLRIRQRLRVSRQRERRRKHRCVELGEKRKRHRVRRHAHADRLSLRMHQPSRQLARCRQDEGVAARSDTLDQGKARVIHDRVAPDLREVPAHERQVVPFVDVAEAAQALERPRGRGQATERVARVRRVCDQAPAAHDLGRAAHKARLRMRGVNGEELRHQLARNSSISFATASG